MPYSFDPELVPILDLLPSRSEGISDPAAIVAARNDPAMEAMYASMPGDPDVRTEDRSVPGLDGDPDVPIRIYAPVAEAEGLRPALLYIHGGGFIMGSIAMTDAGCQRYCSALDAVIVSVEYRLAPEHPYPAGLHDCYAGLVWLADHAAELGVDPARIGVGGGSAGGGLSAATALLARDKGGPALCFQLLQIPELDDRLDTPSMVQFTDTPLWNRPNAEWSWKHYLGDLHGRDDVPYTASPSRCTDLRGLPPAYISTMEYDPLRDEGIYYALALMRDGVQVELHSYPGTFHGSALVQTAAVSKREAAESLDALRRGLAAR